MDFLYGFQETKLKSHLKMAVHRIQLQVNKKTAAVKHAKREIATLLAETKDEKARIKVEHVIREDFTIESLGLLELICELSHERVKYIASEKQCPMDLREAVASLIWAAPRVEVEELDEVKKQLTLKYGKEFAEDALNNSPRNPVNQRLFQKLSVTPPSAFLVIRYLEEIAKEYEVEWVSTDLGLPRSPLPPQPTPAPNGLMGRTATISHDGRTSMYGGGSSSKIAPLPGSSSSGAGAELSMPMASPIGFSIAMAPGSNLQAAYTSQQYNPQPMPVPSYVAQMPPGYGPLSTPQSYQFGPEGAPNQNFPGASDRVPRFNSMKGPKVVLSEETFQMLLKGETFTSDVGGTKVTRNFSVSANLEGIVRWEMPGLGTGDGSNQHMAVFRNFEKVKLDDDNSSSGVYVITLRGKSGLAEDLSLEYQTKNGYRANKWQLALTYCVDRANGRLVDAGDGTMVALERPPSTAPVPHISAPSPAPAVASMPAQQPAVAVALPEPTSAPVHVQASAVDTGALPLPQQGKSAGGSAGSSGFNGSSGGPPPPPYPVPPTYAAGAAAVAGAAEAASPSAPPAPAPAPVKGSGDKTLDDLAARFANLKKR
jgi:vacuolar protein sorting-associated protein IST1